MSTGEPEFIKVEVAYATPEAQSIIALEVPAGATAEEAARLSGIEEQFPEIQLGKNRLGIFGRLVKPAQPLANGDRVEIYRPLLADPKVVRRELAALGKTMGKTMGKTTGNAADKTTNKVASESGASTLAAAGKQNPDES
ncbi:MAG: RnfH family protein [Gammaproteobacteria bacterium]